MEKDVSSRTRNLFYDLIAKVWGKTVDYVELLWPDADVVAPFLVRVHKHPGTEVIKRNVYHGSSWSYYPALIQVKILVKPYA